MVAEIPCTVLHPINCYCDHFHTSNIDLMAVCKNNINIISIEANLYLFLSYEITVSSSAEKILHMTCIQSHDHFLYFIMHLVLPWNSFSSTSKFVANSVLKENIYSFLYTQRATLTCLIEKPFLRNKREKYILQQLHADRTQVPLMATSMSEEMRGAQWHTPSDS